MLRGEYTELDMLTRRGRTELRVFTSLQLQVRGVRASGVPSVYSPLNINTQGSTGVHTTVVAYLTTALVAYFKFGHA